MNSNNYWKNKKVLITGISGFVGKNLAKKLIEKKAIVIGIANKGISKDLVDYEILKKINKIYIVSITNKKKLEEIQEKHNISHIFHLAAQADVNIARKDPYSTFEVNIKGTYNLLTSTLKNKKIKSIVVASSDKSYGSYPKSSLPYKENYELKALYPYDVSKACADNIAKCFSSEIFDMPIVITRFSNIYGPGQLNFSTIIPDLLRSVITNSNFIPRGDGKQIRDFVYIDDVVDLYLIISKNLEINKKKISGEVFNFGSNKPTKIIEIATKIFKLGKKEKKLSQIIKKMKKNKTAGEIDMQYMDYGKVYKFFKFKPTYNLDKGLKKSMEWYKLYFDE